MTYSLREAVWLLLAGLLLAEGWWLYRTRQVARRAVAGLAERQQEYSRLVRQTPALTAESEQALDVDVTQAENAVATRRAAWSAANPAPAITTVAPVKPIDAYFDIAAFVEKARAQAVQAQVKVKPDECFGFASHSRQGPAADLAPAVDRQRVALQYLVEILLAAQPDALLAVQRERPLTVAQRLQRRQSNSNLSQGGVATNGGGQAEDYFELVNRLALRVPGQTDSDAYRLEFSGQTRVLRTFLNRLTAGDWPVIVRSVEAGPLEVRETAHSPRLSSASGAPVPLVAQNLSRFAVVVEMVEFIPGPRQPAS